MDHPGHCKAVLGLGVVDAVAADDGTAGLARRLRAAGEHLSEKLQRLRARPSDDVERIQRGAAHRVHVGERVRGRDPSVVARIVDHRGEEVDGRHQRAPGVELPHRRVVAGLGADQQGLGALRKRQIAQDLRELRGAELAGSTRAVAEEREAHRLGVALGRLQRGAICRLGVHGARSSF